MNDQPVLEAHDLGRTYRDGGRALTVLAAVSFAVAARERVAIIGPSGSGKSTLLGLLAGLDEPSTGSVRVAGQNLAALAPGPLAAFRGRHIGFIFQSHRLLPHCTALENVAIPLELQRDGNAMERARAALTAVGLGERCDHRPSQLSGGEQQRVAIARATVTGPTLVLADEPTGNLDGRTGAVVEELLFGLTAEQGHALVLVTHDPALAERADRVLEIGDGHLLHDRPAHRRPVPVTEPC